MDQPISTRTYALLFIFTAVVYCLGLTFPLLDPDANEYACIAMRMYQQHDFINIISRSVINFNEYDYLDKPHLLFWLAGLSYELFGLHDWAYRLPSILFTVIATYSTFALGQLLYNKETGRMAALIFVTSQAIILANHDVRTDSLLTSCVIFGIWQYVQFLKTNQLSAAILGAVGIGLGVATKGMIAVVVTGIVLACYIIYERQWKTFLNWRWLASLMAFFFTLLPVLYCYFLQFDLHPEKLVNGKYGQSGVKFILWTQSAERFGGGRNFANSPEFSFFYHTLLWAILPWSLLVYFSVFGRIKTFWVNRFKKVENLEFLTLGGLLLVFNFMSISKFKLPHYLNILFPLFAILLASYLYNLVKKQNWNLLNILEKIQLFTIAILILLGFMLNAWFFPIKNTLVLIVAMLLLISLFFIIFKGNQKGYLYRIIIPSAFCILGINFLLNSNFYPQVTRYQAGNEMALIAQKEGIPVKKTYIFKRLYYSFDFYSKTTIPALTSAQIETKNKAGELFYLVVDDDHYKELPAGLNITKRFETPHFHISQLKYNFLNPATRAKAIEKCYLLQIN